MCFPNWGDVIISTSVPKETPRVEPAIFFKGSWGLCVPICLAKTELTVKNYPKIEISCKISPKKVRVFNFRIISSWIRQWIALCNCLNGTMIDKAICNYPLIYHTSPHIIHSPDDIIKNMQIELPVIRRNFRYRTKPSRKNCYGKYWYFVPICIKFSASLPQAPINEQLWIKTNTIRHLSG